MILCSAIHHPEAKERDNLLHMLFNLIKRPDEDQRWGLKIMIMITNRQQHVRYQIYIKYSRVPSEFELPGFYCNLKLQNLSIQYIASHSRSKTTESSKMQV